MGKLIQRWTLTLGAAVLVAAMAAVPAAAQSANASEMLRQICTGYAASQKCDNVDLSGAQSALTGYLQGAGQQGSAANGNVQQVGQQVQAIVQKLNSGNISSGGNAGGSGTAPAAQPVDRQAIEAQLQTLQTQAQQYLSQAGGSAGVASGTSPTSASGQAGGQADPAQVCQNLQDTVDKKITSINASAQDALARLDAAMAKLQAYQSAAGGTATDSQQSLAAAQQAQASATQSVATLSTLSGKVDCGQSASAVAAALSTVKASADSTKSQLQDFQKTLTQLITDLAANAQS